MPRLTRLRLWNAHKPVKLFDRKTETYLKILQLSLPPDPHRRPPRISQEEKERLQGHVTHVERRAPKNRGTNLPLLHRYIVSGKLKEFIEKANLSREQCIELLEDGPRYFSRPHNVPVHLRKQVYLPTFKVTLLRTPHLPPKYASFDVPLWFNKFDMKSYLASVYDVDVLHVRSTVIQQKITRDQNGRRGTSSQGRGRFRRPASKKKMTVELVEPFVWPEEIKDLAPWEPKMYYGSGRYQLEGQKQMAPDAILKPNEKHQKSIAEQARDAVAGKARWKPTWQSLPIDLKALPSSRSPPSTS